MIKEKAHGHLCAFQNKQKYSSLIKTGLLLLSGLLLLRLVNSFLQELASTESRNLASRDLNLLAGTRVVALASLAIMHFKGTKTNKNYILTIGKSVLNSLKQSRKSIFSILLG